MSARLTAMLLSAAVGSCEASSRAPEHAREHPVEHLASHPGAGSRAGETAAIEQQASPDVLDCEPPLACSMAGQSCPSSQLPRFSKELDAAGWTQLLVLAERGVVAIVLGERVELVEGCQLPGRYHEAVAAPESPGRAWASDRLVLLPDEPRECERATHFVASFAIRGEHDGVAIALPLPCPPLGSGKPRGCIGAGLDDAAREAATKSRWQQAEPLLQRYEYEDIDRAIPLMLEITALLPVAWSYGTLAQSLRFLGQGQRGGCLWLAEAELAAQSLRSENPATDHELRRVAPSHEYPDCRTRPSLLTCFPEHFVPGVGDNCW